MNTEPEESGGDDELSPPASHDAIFALIVDTFLKSSTSVNITLIVDGTFVSGDIISTSEFFAGVGGQLDAAWPSKDIKFSWEKHFRELFEEVAKPSAMGWIHLRRVTIAGPGVNPYQVPFWRGLLTHVGGWHLGGAKYTQE